MNCAIWCVSYLSWYLCSVLKSTSNSQLPVRTLLFQCSVCKHGGHQACYRDYYAHGPNVEIGASRYSDPPPVDAPLTLTLPNLDDGPPGTPGTPRRHSSIGLEGDSGPTGSGSNSIVDLPSVRAAASTSFHAGEKRSRLLGYPCATGCGHVCWASNVGLGSTSEGSDKDG